MKQLAWNEQEFKKSMHRINIQDTEIRGLLDQVNLSFILNLTFNFHYPGDEFKNILVWCPSRFDSRC